MLSNWLTSIWIWIWKPNWRRVLFSHVAPIWWSVWHPFLLQFLHGHASGPNNHQHQLTHLSLKKFVITFRKLQINTYINLVLVENVSNHHPDVSKPPSNFPFSTFADRCALQNHDVFPFEGKNWDMMCLPAFKGWWPSTVRDCIRQSWAGTVKGHFSSCDSTTGEKIGRCGRKELKEKYSWHIVEGLK